MSSKQSWFSADGLADCRRSLLLTAACLLLTADCRLPTAYCSAGAVGGGVGSLRWIGLAFACGAPLNGRFCHQQGIWNRFLLDRCLGTAEDRAAEKQGGPTKVMEFPRHVSPHVPAESAVEVSLATQLYPIASFRWQFACFLKKKEKGRRYAELISPAKTANLSTPRQQVPSRRTCCAACSNPANCVDNSFLRKGVPAPRGHDGRCRHPRHRRGDRDRATTASGSRRLPSESYRGRAGDPR